MSWSARVGLGPASLLLITSLLLPISLFGLGAWESHDQLYRSAETRMLHQLAGLHEQAQRVLQTQQLFIQQAEHLLRGLTPDQIRESKELWAVLRKLVDDVPEVDALLVTDADGAPVLSTREYPPPDVTFADRDFFIEHRDRESGILVGHSRRGKIRGQPIFSLSLRRPDEQGRFGGIIAVALSTDYFLRYYERISLRQDRAAVTLLRDTGQVLIRYSARSSEAAGIGSELIRNIGEAQQGLLYASIGGSPRIVAYKRLDELPIYVTYSISESAIRAEWERALLPWAALALGAAILLVISTGLIIQRSRREAEAVRCAQQTNAELLQEIQRREEAEASLLQSQKLEALGQLTGGIAHDFNNLLQVVGGNLELIESQAPDDPTRQRAQRCQTAVERGRKLMQQLLAFARRQPLHSENFALHDRIRGLQEMLTHAAPRVKLRPDLAEDLWPIEADPNQLDLALMNLVLNARDAMPGGGPVEITTRNMTLSGEHNLAGEFVAVTVKDHGSGMPAEVLARVWEPFFTTKPRGKGTGLGLSMVYGFAKQSGGGVTIESEAGAGTTVTLYLRKGDPALVAKETGMAAARDAAARRSA